MSDSSESDDLRRAADGDLRAVAALFTRHRDRLKQMVRLRMDHRLQGRVDPSDVLQDAFLEVSRRIGEYARAPTVPVYLWLRALTGQSLVDLMRRHLGAKMRAAGQEISLHRGALPQASSASLAAQLLGQATSPSLAAIRVETRIRVQDALAGMDPIDREVLALRHFEMLSNTEVAQVLGLSKAAASNRYIRALRRLKAILATIQGLGDWPGPS